MYLITSFLYFISSSLDDELSALDFWYFCRRGDSTFTIARCCTVFFLAARKLIPLQCMIFEKFGERPTRKITTPTSFSIGIVRISSRRRCGSMDQRRPIAESGADQQGIVCAAIEVRC